MFLMAASDGEAFNGFVLIFLRLYPLTCFKGTKGKSLWVKLFGIGLWLIRILSLQPINDQMAAFSI